MQRTLKIIVVLAGMYNPLFFKAQAQTGSLTGRQGIMHNIFIGSGLFTGSFAPVQKISGRESSRVYGSGSHTVQKPGNIANREFSLFNRVIFPLSASHYVRTLGFFCTRELKLDRLTPVPFRFRLGSLDYVNWMEGKPNAGLKH